MSVLQSIRGTTIVLCTVFAASVPSTADDRPASKILAEINAVELPERPTNRDDQAAIRDFVVKQRQAMEKKSDLIGELYKVNPDSPDLATLLPMRWAFLRMKPAALPSMKAEVEQVLATSKDEKLIVEASYVKMLVELQTAGVKAKPEELLPMVDEFARKFPSDARIPNLLMSLANVLPDADAKEALFKRIEKDYPKSMAARQVGFARARAEADRKRLERVGKPFELEFTDAIKGTKVTMAGLKGKVVVVDFWATWCGPCIDEMPNMKKLYAEYKDKGVEFIGVSLDQSKEKGGLDKLKDYVAKNEVEWPQYYQGNFWQSEFSMSWGINSIPCVFLVDTDGNLASVDARGKLESMIPEYLDKAKAKPSKTAAIP